jgi:hypothetical protein
VTAEPMATQSALFQAHRGVVEPTRETPRAAWRLSEMALLLAEIWLLVAVAVTAAGEGVFGLLFGGTAILWVLIAAFEAHETYERLLTRSLRGQVRRQAILSHS